MLSNNGVLKRVALTYLCLEVFLLGNTFIYSLLYFQHKAECLELSKIYLRQWWQSQQYIKLVPPVCSSWTHDFTGASASDLQIRLADDWPLLDLSRIPRTWRPIVSSTAAVVFTTSKSIFRSLLLAFWRAYLNR